MDPERTPANISLFDWQQYTQELKETHLELNECRRKIFQLEEQVQALMKALKTELDIKGEGLLAKLSATYYHEEEQDQQEDDNAIRNREIDAELKRHL